MRAIVISLSLLVSACANEEAPIDDSPEGEMSAENLAAETESLPDTDIYLADLSVDGLAPEISNVRLMIAGPGYANQPHFVDNDAFVFTEEGASGKTDLWRYDIASDERTRLTDSADASEYSPKPSPDGGISYIQESPDGEMTRVHVDGEAVIEFAPLGYYEWIGGGKTLGVFYRSDIPELHLVDVETGVNTKIITGLGRSLQSSADGATLYFSAKGEAGNQLYALELGNDPRALLAMPGDGEDFRIVFNKKGEPLWVFASDGADIRYHAYPRAPGETWPVAESFRALGALSRMVINDDNTLIAIVAAAAE